ncbi:MAG: exo-alpha-sialidase [Acidimicrobiales bacterium]
MKKALAHGGVAVCALVLLAEGSAMAADPIRVSSPVQATKFDTTPSRMYGTPDLAVDPEDPMNVVATLPELPTKRCGLMRSTDGGVTWRRLDASPSPPSYPFCLMQGNSNVTQGLLAFGRNHTLYYAFTGWDTQDGEDNGSVFVGRSTDFGKSWTTTTVRDNRTQTNPKERDRPISGLAVDRRSGGADVVAVSWRYDPLGLDEPNLLPIAPFVSVSTDGAKTFAPAVNLASIAFESEALRSAALKSAPAPSASSSTTPTTAPPAGSRAAQPNQVANFGGSNPSVTVDGKGNLYSAWVFTSANIDPAPQFAHFLSKSSDKGKTWTTSQISPFSANNTNGYNALHLAWSPKGGAEGSLHFVYDGSNQPKISNFTQVFYRRSVDGGVTWSDVKVMNDTDPAKFTYSGDPNVAVAPNGRVDVAWWDTRNDPGIAANDVYYASSDDGGVTWSKNTRVTDRVIDRKIGVYSSNFDLAGPPGIGSTDEYAMIGWDDTRDGDAVTNTQDIYVGMVQYEPLASGTSNAVKYVLAAVVGLLLVGLGLVVAAVVVRSRGGRSGIPSETKLTKPAVRQ